MTSATDELNWQGRAQRRTGWQFAQAPGPCPNAILSATGFCSAGEATCGGPVPPQGAGHHAGGSSPSHS
jgi:hypothetical protein